MKHRRVNTYFIKLKSIMDTNLYFILFYIIFSFTFQVLIYLKSKRKYNITYNKIIQYNKSNKII